MRDIRCLSTFLKCSLSIGFILLSSCSFMPSTGPHASLILDETKHHKGPTLIRVSSQYAADIAKKVADKEKARDRALIHRLSAPITVVHKVAVGDVLRLTIWSQRTNDNLSSLSSVGTSSLQPEAHSFGVYTVDHMGSIDLPYANRVHILGLTYAQAEAKIERALNSTSMFESIAVIIQSKISHDQNVVLLGAVHKPVILNWNEGGIDLVEAIAQAGGYELSEPLQGTDMGMNIMLSRHGSSYDIPLRLAIQNSIPLHPGDRVALQHKPTVRVLALGSGWTKPTVVPFNQTPTLAQVMGSANGLNFQTAQGRTIFIMKKDRSAIYLIDFDKTDGMNASQIFPVEDGDMVYVPVTRSVTLQQVMTMFLTIAYPGTIAGAGVR